VFDLFWELGQQRNTPEVGSIIEQAREKVEDVSGEVKALRGAVNKLMLINRALWEIIAEEKGLDDKYLMDKVNEIDLRDGTYDGKLVTAIMLCPSCERTLFKGHDKCLYCGSTDTATDPFYKIDPDPSDTAR
jgi:RNA polymerase subunit RPABC4/transcription elongation factor Spt4